MSKTETARRVAMSLALMSMISAAAAQAQSTAPAGTTTPVRKETAAKRPATSAPGPFTYDAVGATPKVRKPAKRGVSSTNAVKAPDGRGQTTNVEPATTYTSTSNAAR